jgi:c-di-GMP-binding flagellar brake protein YcgR
MLRPVNPPLLLAKAQQFLDISWRETYRVLLSAPVEGKAGSDTFFCRSQDISTSGMLIETDKKLMPGGPVMCSITLPDGTKVQAAGEVARTLQQASGAGDNRYGVRFLNLPPETQRILDAFVDKKVLENRSRVA